MSNPKFFSNLYDANCWDFRYIVPNFIMQALQIWISFLSTAFSRDVNLCHTRSAIEREKCAITPTVLACVANMCRGRVTRRALTIRAYYCILTRSSSHTFSFEYKRKAYTSDRRMRELSKLVVLIEITYAKSEIHPGTLVPMGVLSSAQINCWFRDWQQTDRQTDRQTDKRQNASIEKPSQSSKNLITPND